MTVPSIMLPPLVTSTELAKTVSPPRSSCASSTPIFPVLVDDDQPGTAADSEPFVVKLLTVSVDDVPKCAVRTGCRRVHKSNTTYHFRQYMCM